MLFVSVSGLVVRAACVCENGIRGPASPEAAGVPSSPTGFLAPPPPHMESLRTEEKRP